MRTLPDLGSNAVLSPDGRRVLTVPAEGYPPATKIPDDGSTASSVRDTAFARFVVLDLADGVSREVPVPAPADSAIVVTADLAHGFWSPDSSRVANKVCVSDTAPAVWDRCTEPLRVAVFGPGLTPALLTLDGELVGWHDTTTLVTVSPPPAEIETTEPVKVDLVDSASGEVKRSLSFTLPYRDQAGPAEMNSVPRVVGGDASVSPTGRTLGVRMDNRDWDGPQWVFSVDLATGAVSEAGEVPNKGDMGSRELLWRGDEPLVGLSDRVVSAADPNGRPLVAIHPMTDLRPTSWAANAFSGPATSSALGTQAPWPFWFWKESLVVAALIAAWVLLYVCVRRRSRPEPNRVSR